ncbi:MAG TPA: CpsD/CapB family tyrosine-protein kinase [Bryobacterales bacterium]|nr:CpsD/CapB family tyrosine-protein kinase [Bryobacterales bacterium]
MSRHLEILRRARLDGELFARAAAAGNGHSRGANGGTEVPPDTASGQGAPSPAETGAGDSSWNNGHSRDQWQQLIHHLFLRRGSEGRLSVGLGSATAGEGTSFVAFHLATELARSTAQPTLLLETNVHRPAQAQQHGVDADPGLRHLLLDKSFPLESCLRQTGIEQLWLLPAGSAVNGSGSALDWTHFRRVFDGLRERFCGIIADLPPVNLSSDAMIIGPVFDGVVLVVEADLCSREVIQSAAARLRRANPNVMGTILNKRKFFIPAPLYRRL